MDREWQRVAGGGLQRVAGGGAADGSGPLGGAAEEAGPGTGSVQHPAGRVTVKGLEPPRSESAAAGGPFPVPPGGPHGPQPRQERGGRDAGKVRADSSTPAFPPLGGRSTPSTATR